MSPEELVKEVEAQRNLMVAVATGGPKIDQVNDEYVSRRMRISAELESLRIVDPVPYRDLWAWYGKWRSDLPTYQSRRTYLSDLFAPLLDRLRSAGDSNALAGEASVEPTGWARVDRALDIVRDRLSTVSTEEEYQTIGLLCRETLISLAQAVYIADTHGSRDGTTPSETDANRMLEAFIGIELSGGSNEEARKHARAALALANALQHRRTADFRTAALCAEATTSVVNAIAIIAGRRDPHRTRAGHDAPASHATRSRWRSELAKLAKRAHSRQEPLSQIIAEARSLAQEMNDRTLFQFCTSELEGYSASTFDEFEAIQYRGLDAYCTAGRINTSHPQFAGNASGIFSYIETHRDQFFERILVIQEPISSLEARVAPTRPGTFLKSVFPATDFDPETTLSDLKIHCYSRADGYREILERVRAELTKHFNRAADRMVGERSLVS
jgi:hypothetical protein